MSEQKLDVLLEEHSDQTNNLLKQKQVKELEEKRRALGIDSGLRALATDKKLLQFLESREADLPLVFEKYKRGPILRITADGAVICSSYGDNEYTETFKLKNVRDEEQARRLGIDKDDVDTYADFIDGNGLAFVRVGGNSTWGSKGDFLASKYTWDEPFAGVTAKSLDEQAIAQVAKIVTKK